MSTDRHSTKPKAVRMPGGLEARMKAAVEGTPETVNGFIVAAIEERLERREGGSTTPAARTQSGSTTRMSREDTAPAAVFVAAEPEQPQRPSKNCKHPKVRVKGVCPDCDAGWVTK